MPFPIPIAGPYPSIEEVFLKTRVDINDAFAGATNTQGEGRVFTDNYTPTITVLNIALQYFQRDIESLGFPTTRERTAILGLTPVHGAGGLGVADPNTQVYLGYGGYFDGTTLNAGIVLPVDLLVPLKIRSRIHASNGTYTEVHEAPDGLPSCAQNIGLGRWEWITDRIYFNGSTNTIDIELWYTGSIAQYATSLSPSLFPTTLIPFLDSGDALAYKCAYIFCAPRLPKGAADELQANYEAAVQRIAGRWIKAKPQLVQQVAS